MALRHRRGPHAEVFSYLARADVLVLPSYQEALGTVVLEAFVSKLPAIASRVGGIPETVRDNYNGLLIEPRDVKSLEDAMWRLIDAPDLLQRLTIGAAETGKRYEWPQIAQRLERLYHSVITRPSAWETSTRERLAADHDFGELNPWEGAVWSQMNQS